MVLLMEWIGSPGGVSYGAHYDGKIDFENGTATKAVHVSLIASIERMPY